MALRYELQNQGNFLFKYRSYLPILIIVPGLIVYLLKEKENLLNFTIANKAWYEVGCIVVCFLGLFIRILAVGFSSDNTSGRNTKAGQIADSINSTGLYATVRHPLYVGNFFMWLGIAGFTFNFWFIIAFIFMYWVYYERIMYAEEEFLIKTYGDSYLAYSKNVPAFIPNFKAWVKPKNTFSFIKIIRQEKTGILNIFLVAFVFKLCRYLLLDIAIEKRWIAGIIFGVGYYIIIKIIQKTTNLLTNDR